MKITRVEALPVAVPYKPGVDEVVTAGLVLTEARHVLVVVHTDEGLIGLGEAVPRPSIYGETVDSVIACLRDLLVPPILGADPRNVERLWTAWAKVIGNTTAKSAIDVACHDILGKAARLPLYKLLGGASDPVVPIGLPLGIADDDRILDQVRKAVAAGFETIKLKVGKDLDRDIRVVTSVCEVAGTSVGVYVDANQNYSTSAALRAARAFEECGVNMFEEPVAGYDVDGRVRVAQSTTIPLLIDESVATPADAVRELKAGTPGAFSVRSPRTGVTWSQKVVGLADAAGLSCLVGSHRELGVGTATNLHLAAAYACMRYPAELGHYGNHADGLVQPALEIADGYMRVPDGPGLGISLNNSVEHYQLGDPIVMDER